MSDHDKKGPSLLARDDGAMRMFDEEAKEIETEIIKTTGDKSDMLRFHKLHTTIMKNIHDLQHAALDEHYQANPVFDDDRRRLRLDLTHKLTELVAQALNQLRYCNMVTAGRETADEKKERHERALRGVEDHVNSELKRTHKSRFEADHERYLGLMLVVVRSTHHLENDHMHKYNSVSPPVNRPEQEVEREFKKSIQYVIDEQQKHKHDYNEPTRF